MERVLPYTVLQPTVVSEESVPLRMTLLEKYEEEDEWERACSTVKVADSENQENDMDFTDTEQDNNSWDDPYSCPKEIGGTSSSEKVNRIDWNNSDWQRPDRDYVQAVKRLDGGRRSLDQGKQSTKYEDGSWPEKPKQNRRQSINGMEMSFMNRRNSAIKRDWNGNEILPEDDWAYGWTNVGPQEIDRDLKCIRL